MRSTVCMTLILSIVAASFAAAAEDEADETATTTRPASALPAKTSRYNVGDAPGRYRDAAKKVRRFEPKHPPVALYDGAGREIGRVGKPVMLNIGAAKSMDVDGDGKAESYAWAWATEAGSGWVAREALVDPPPPDTDPARNPKPPRESD